MKSKTSFFNFTLVRKNIVRFSPIWITYLVIFIVGLPLIMGVTLSSQPADLHTTPAMDMAYYAGTVLEIVGPDRRLHLRPVPGHGPVFLSLQRPQRGDCTTACPSAAAACSAAITSAACCSSPGPTRSLPCWRPW